MKILQVVPYLFLSWAGGNPTLAVTYNLSKSLFDQGHQITIYTTDALNKGRKLKYPTEPLNTHGVKVYEFKSMGSKLGERHRIYISPAMIPVMAKQIATFDIIHLQEYRTFQNIIAHYYAKKHKIPYVLQAHGALPRIMTKHRLKQVYDTLWGYRLLKDAARVIAVTRREAEQYKSMGVSEDKIEMVPNGIYLSEFKNLPKRGEFRRKWGIKGSQKIVFYLARIHKIKGPDLLVKAFAALSEESNEAKLVIAGPDDGYLPTLKKLIKELNIEDKVLLTGPLYGRDRLEAYIDADVYVLPSSYEVFGITVLEACACGTPVILTDRCGVAEWIGNNAGYVVQYDKTQLRGAISEMLTNEELRMRFKEAGKKLIREQFSWPKIAEQIETVYKSVRK
ncbi:glycosyltransferase [Chloroflexota bacterium]